MILEKHPSQAAQVGDPSDRRQKVPLVAARRPAMPSSAASDPQHQTAPPNRFTHSGSSWRTNALFLVAVLCANLAVIPHASAQTSADAPEPSTPGEQYADADVLDDIDLFDLDIPIVVTASRKAQSLATVPFAMSVVTANDIRLSGARSIPEALRLVPGVDVAELTDGNAAVAPRGTQSFTARTVLVLIDGRQIFDSFFGGTLWGSWPIQLEDIDRIEVIRGPGGVTWGANAVNGVINIITKDPEKQQGLTLRTTAGSRGIFSQYVGYGMREGKLRLRLSATYEGSDGFRKGGSIIKSLDDKYRASRAGLHAVYDASENDKYSFWAGHATRENGFPTSPLAGIGMQKRGGSLASFVKATWSHTIDEDNAFEWTAYINDFGASPGTRQIDYRYQQFALQFKRTATLPNSHEIVWGMDTRVDLLDLTNSDPYVADRRYVSTFTGGVYYADRWQFAPKWMIDLGARIDYDSYGGFEPSARAAISYAPDDHSMYYAAVSRAFQMPPGGFRFLRIPLVNGLSHVNAAQGMKPRTVLAYELGYRTRIEERVDLAINAFWHETDGITPLQPQLNFPDILRMDIDNRAESSTYGVEVDLKYAVSKQLTLVSNYTFQREDWRSVVQRYLSDSVRMPKNKAMVGARYAPTDEWDLSAHLYFVDATDAPNPANPFAAQRIDPYLRLDLRAEYEFQEDASIAVGVRNLLDPDHPEGATLFLNDAEVPRTVYAELRIAIK
jgi:iron complex outermembrane recepter protein